MSLPWVRLDSNIAAHDKILDLLADVDIPKAVRWQAVASYMFSFAHSGGHDTDGLIKFSTLAAIHGTKETEAALVKHYLHSPDPLGWRVVNYDKRQQTSATTRQIRNAQSAGAQKANCVRWHGKDCGCWEATG